MMRKVMLSLIALDFFLLYAKAEPFEVDGIWYEVTSDHTVMVVPEPTPQGSGTTFVFRNYYKGDIQIPQTVFFQEVYYSVTAAQEATFRESGELTSVSIPSTLTSLGTAPFAACPLLNTLSVESDNAAYAIADGILYDKAMSTLIACPATMTGIVSIPSSVTTIAPSAFRGCAYLSGIVVPQTVTEVGKRAFEGCKRVASLDLPNGIISISDSTFYNCRDLKTISIPQTALRIGVRAFYHCNNLASITIPDAVQTIDNFAFSLCYRLSSIQLPVELRTIGQRAFENCSNLSSLSIPAQVHEIGTLAFCGCSSLQSITVDETNSSFLSLDGVLFDKDMKTLLCCPSARQGDFIIPSSVCTIGEYGFYSCRYLKNVVLSPSLTNIQEGAFRLCTALRSVTLPSNVSSMGDNIFVACSALEKIVCYVPHPFDINASTFTSGNYNVPLYVLKRALDDYKNAPYWSQFAAILPIDGTVVDGLLGDVNNDGFINMSDVTIIINYILGREVNDFRWQQADMNFDGFINMSDVTGVINFILGNTTEDTEE